MVQGDREPVSKSPFLTMGRAPQVGVGVVELLVEVVDVVEVDVSLEVEVEVVLVLDVEVVVSLEVVDVELVLVDVELVLVDMLEVDAVVVVVT